MILFIHHRYRQSGGEERAIEDLLWLVRSALGEDAELLERRSETVGRVAAAAGVAGGGLSPGEVGAAVTRTGARIVHAHNLHPTFGWRALAAARAAGARVVLHLHQFRTVCAIGIDFRDGAVCMQCHGRNTLPGLIHNCRGSWPQAAAYATGIALWQRRLLAQADAVVVPSAFARRRLDEQGVALGDAFVLPNVTPRIAGAPSTVVGGPALLAARLVPEKGIEVAAQACAIAGVPLVVAGAGPERQRLEGRPGVTFAGHVTGAELARLRATASVALVPSLMGESFGLAAAEAMAAGLPVVGFRTGALAELLPADWLSTPGDVRALAETILRLRDDPAARLTALHQARTLTGPDIVAPRLAEIYAHAIERR